MIASQQVRKILELVQSKGEEASEYFVYVLHEAYDAYIDLRPWFKEIQYKPSDSIKEIQVINTDPSKCATCWTVLIKLKKNVLV